MNRTIRHCAWAYCAGQSIFVFLSLTILFVMLTGLVFPSSAAVMAQAPVPTDSAVSSQAQDAGPSSPDQTSEVESGGWVRLCRERSHVLLIVLVFFVLVLVFTNLAGKGTGLEVRDIPGIRAIQRAVERAAEQGKSVLYVPGVFDVDNIQTIASMAILAKVAKETATKDVRLIVPLNRAFLIPLAEESVKKGMGEVGKVDTFDPDNIRYLSDDHFAYAAAVDGIMLRERPAACLYMGGFGAESLILAETGYIAGSIQIAGTAETQQLPFLVAACDEALIGEEFYAASAYISRDATLLGTLKAADIIKAIIIVAIMAGSVLELLGLPVISRWFTVQ